MADVTSLKAGVCEEPLGLLPGGCGAGLELGLCSSLHSAQINGEEGVGSYTVVLHGEG